ncbi:MAG: family 1 glycosylhydrolase [Verrucomicrobiota bacterium]|nr:family 1 glycosylhydrolase [Verrucomicrobiota bacterium]
MALDKFLWGVSTSAYQSEGGYNGLGQPQNNWTRWERDGSVHASGKSAEFWTRFEHDFELSAGLGLTAFRLGIDWVRLQPESPAQVVGLSIPNLNQYVDILSACRKKGLEPLVTLQHFVHPEWLGADPWLQEETLTLFENFAVETLTYINTELVARGFAPIKWLITVNEPDMLVFNQYVLGIFPGSRFKGWVCAQRAYRNMIRAHVRVYTKAHRLYKEKGWEAPMISFNNFCNDLFWTERVWLEIIEHRRKGVDRKKILPFLKDAAVQFNRTMADAMIPFRKDLSYYIGTLMKGVHNAFGAHLFSQSFLDPLLDDMEAAEQSSFQDYIAFDYYDPFIAHAFRWPVWGDHEFQTKSWPDRVMHAVTSKWWDWRVLPEGFSFFLDSYATAFPGLPIVVAENGMATRRPVGQDKPERPDKISRSVYLQKHLQEVLLARQRGIPVSGYFYWSLTDNYEWGSFSPRFGLYTIDFDKSPERLATHPDGDEPSKTYRSFISGLPSNF